MDDSFPFNNMLNPVERRLSSDGRSFSINDDDMGLNEWFVGESSSASTSQNEIPNNGSKIEHNWSSSSDVETRPEEPERETKAVTTDANLNENNQIPNISSSSSDVNSSYFMENEVGSSSSLSTFGLSYKRKTLEGTSQQSSIGEPNSSFLTQGQNIVLRRSSPSSGSLTISSSPVNTPAQTTIGEPNSHVSETSIGSSSRHQSSLTDRLDARLRSPLRINSSNPPNQSPSRNMAPSPWPEALNTRRLRNASNIRRALRNRAEQPLFGPLSDPADLTLLTASSSSDSSRRGTRQNSPTRNRETFPDYLYWDMFPEVEVEVDTGGQRGHFTSVDTLMSSPPSGHGRRSLRSLSTTSMINAETERWRALASHVEGTRQLVSEQVRQAFSAMGRGENLLVEMALDSFNAEFHQLHDRHVGMRLDVDNMSYEELLALEERIGNVSTGLNEDVILRNMRRRELQTLPTPSSNLEPCSICREDYVIGDDMGSLDCGHDFHTLCIKQWLTLKNLCPVCKMTGLKNSDKSTL